MWDMGVCREGGTSCVGGRGYFGGIRWKRGTLGAGDGGGYIWGGGGGATLGGGTLGGFVGAGVRCVRWRGDLREELVKMLFLGIFGNILHIGRLWMNVYVRVLRNKSNYLQNFIKFDGFYVQKIIHYIENKHGL